MVRGMAGILLPDFCQRSVCVTAHVRERTSCVCQLLGGQAKGTRVDPIGFWVSPVRQERGSGLQEACTCWSLVYRVST